MENQAQSQGQTQGQNQAQKQSSTSSLEISTIPRRNNYKIHKCPEEGLCGVCAPNINVSPNSNTI